MNPLPESWHKLVHALAGSEAEWQTPEQIASALAESLDETTDLLATLDVEGLLDVWERADGLVVALSPLGASVAKLQIVEQGRGEIPTWRRVGDPLPPVPRARGVAASARGADFETLADPRPLNAPGNPGRRDSPSLLIGLGTSPWPNPPTGAVAVCPICGSRRLPAHAYCLYCDRWGGDPSEEDRSNPDNSQKPSHPSPPRDLSADERAVRAARKAKQRERMSERIRETRKSHPGRNKSRS